MPSVNPTEILAALREFTARERVDFLPPAPDLRPLSPYPPIGKYLLDLKQGAKPESAAEDLFTALCKDVLGFEPTRQVGLREGFVDFMLPEPMGEPLPLELKPLFQRDGPDALWRSDANPKNHVAQVKKYLRDNEYLILTDLRTAWVFSARDFYFEDQAFAELPFADFLARCRETRSVLDTLRRLEDTAEKPELEQQFFEDLRTWFNEFDKVRWSPPELAAESIILLINKLIFARTLEDYGLVQYRFTQGEYARFTRLWEPKGAHRVIPKFLDSFEEFFDEYYDTEIFSTRVWDRLDKDPDNLKRFCEKLNFVLGINPGDQVFSRGIVHYNYRRIDEDIFGKSYEMFLAANRKDEGIYYTPAGITGPMADSLVNSLAEKLVAEICDAVGNQRCDFARAGTLMAQLAEIRVADTACGSGGFLIKVLRAFWQHYQRIDAACAWVGKILKPDNGELYLAELPPNVEAALAFRRQQNLDNRRVLIAQILLRHVFGVDKDPGALEVAKTNIWKEAVKLSPADYNYRLLKTDIVKILPNLELNFLAADSLVDVATEQQTAWLAEYHQAELKKLSELRARYLANPMRHEALDEALALRGKVRADFVEHFQGANLPGAPAGFALQFWPCWFDADGTRKGMGGTGDPPVPPGDSPGGMQGASANQSGGQSKAFVAAVPVGGSPTGAGESPAPPVAGFDGIIGTRKGMGSTGDPPVPPGDSPDGMQSASANQSGGQSKTFVAAVPVGGSPTGAGESPAPPAAGFDGIIGTRKGMGGTGDPPVPPGDSPDGMQGASANQSGGQSKTFVAAVPVGGSPTGAGESPAPPAAGFDAIIGNPPWEGFKPFRKEFAAKFHPDKPQFSKMGMDGPAFEKWFVDELKANKEFAARWRDYETGYVQHSEYFGRRFKYQGGGDYNLYKLFIEEDIALLRAGGRLSLLVPSGLQTDEGCGPLRKLLLTEHCFEELTSFENRGWREVDEHGKEKRKQIFPDVHPQFKFGFFKMVKGGGVAADHCFNGRFYLHDPKDVFTSPILYSVEMIRRFSPENFSIMEFRSETHYTLCGIICGEHPRLPDLGFQFGSELHLTNDAHFFRKLIGKQPSTGQMPLYEGKMVHQFDASFSPANWFVVEKDVREQLLRKEVFRAIQFIREEGVAKVGGKRVPGRRDELGVLLQEQFDAGKFKLQYEYERLGSRDVGRSTDERTLIATVLPTHVCIGNTINYLRPFRYATDAKGNLQQEELGEPEVYSLLCLLNSFVLNYFVRSKVSAHVNIHQLYELPVPQLSAVQKQKLVESAAKLLKKPRDVRERAALEVFIARELYGLSFDDWEHLTGTFTFGSGATKEELDEIIRQSLVLWKTAG